MKSLNFDEFISRINYDELASQEQQNELRHWLEMIGVYKYDKYYKVLHKEAIDITFDDLKNCAIYDFNLSRILFAMLKHCENYLRATVTSNIEDFALNKNNYFKKIKEKFGLKKGWKVKIEWPGPLKGESSFYKFIDASGFLQIIKYYLNLPLEGIIFDQNDLGDNLFAVNRLRNRVYHHNCLLDDKFKKNELKSKIMIIFHYLPSRGTRSRYIDLIEEESNRVGNKYSYPIHFSPEERYEIIMYRGCNNEYKN